MTPTLARAHTRQAEAARRAARECRLRQELDRMLALLRALPDVERVIAFGSVARGDVRGRSDLDLVVVRRTPEAFRERVETLLRLLRPRVPTDVLVYTPPEWRDMAAQRPFGRRVAREGNVLYESRA